MIEISGPIAIALCALIGLLVAREIANLYEYRISYWLDKRRHWKGIRRKRSGDFTEEETQFLRESRALVNVWFAKREINNLDILHAFPSETGVYEVINTGNDVYICFFCCTDAFCTVYNVKTNLFEAD